MGLQSCKGWDADLSPVFTRCMSSGTSAGAGLALAPCLGQWLQTFDTLRSVVGHSVQCTLRTGELATGRLADLHLESLAAESRDPPGDASVAASYR